MDYYLNIMRYLKYASDNNKNNIIKLLLKKNNIIKSESIKDLLELACDKNDNILFKLLYLSEQKLELNEESLTNYFIKYTFINKKYEILNLLLIDNEIINNEIIKNKSIKSLLNLAINNKNKDDTNIIDLLSNLDLTDNFIISYYFDVAISKNKENIAKLIIDKNINNTQNIKHLEKIIDIKITGISDRQIDGEPDKQKYKDYITLSKLFRDGHY
jgi:hypothetical protein